MRLFVPGTGQGISGQPVPKAPVVLLAAWDPTSRKGGEEGDGHGGSHLYLAFKRLRQEVGGQLGLHRCYFLQFWGLRRPSSRSLTPVANGPKTKVALTQCSPTLKTCSHWEETGPEVAGAKCSLPTPLRLLCRQNITLRMLSTWEPLPDT